MKKKTRRKLKKVVRSIGSALERASNSKGLTQGGLTVGALVAAVVLDPEVRSRSLSLIDAARDALRGLAGSPAERTAANGSTGEHTH